MAAPAAQQSRRRALRITGLVVFQVLVLFLLLELGMRGLGIGADTRSSSLAYQEVFLPAMVPAERPDGTPTWRTWDPRVPFQAVPREKAPDALRVFVFGGSATAGLGYSPNVTFARRLEELLEHGYPERSIEVVNLGVVAISAEQVRILLEDVVERYEPDLLVVYSGNNEFLELHAGKYRAAHASFGQRIADLARRTNLYRWLHRRVHGPLTPADLPLRDPGVAEEERLTQARIVRDVEVSEEEREQVVVEYSHNLARMTLIAFHAEVPLLLCSVAVNAEWRGREDLPEDWVGKELGRSGSLEEVRAALDARLAERDLAPLERWEATYRRAVARRALGDPDGARADFGAALELDPHLRRALPAQRAFVRLLAGHPHEPRVAIRHGALGESLPDELRVATLDTVALFEATAPDGILGFEHFYDYVHLTPRGTAELAVGIYRAMQELDGVPRGLALELDDYAAEHARAVEALERDRAPLDEFLGIGFEPSNVHDRDLWKYERMARALDERLAAQPDDALALTFRGDVRAFRQDGAAGAAADYRRALELDPDLEATRANLAQLEEMRATK